LKGLALVRFDHLASNGKAKYRRSLVKCIGSDYRTGREIPIAPLSDTGGMGFIKLGAFYNFGPTQLSAYFEGISDHGDKHKSFQGFISFCRGASAVFVPYSGIVRNAFARLWLVGHN
jgi:hypothetical protein